MLYSFLLLLLFLPFRRVKRRRGAGVMRGGRVGSIGVNWRAAGRREIKEAPSGNEGVNVKEIGGPPVEIGSSM